MPNQHKAGTGDKIGTIDLGPIGTIDLFDDGDTDECVAALDPNTGNYASLTGILSRARHEHGDTFVIDALEDAVQPAPKPTRTTYQQVSFKCDGCNLTWPGPRNQTPDVPADLCPNCYDD